MRSGAQRRLPAAPASTVLYVALGDSTVDGEGASAPDRHYVGRLQERLRTVYPGARLKNLGVGGATAADVLSRQLPQALGLRPDLVTLSIGPNDITRERSLWAYARDIEAILGALNRGTTAVVVVNLIPDLTVTPRFKGKEIEPLVHKRVVAFNEILATRARASGAEVVDLYGASRQEVPRRPELIGADGYHPSDAGYARWAELMWAAIEARIARYPSLRRSRKPGRARRLLDAVRAERCRLRRVERGPGLVPGRALRAGRTRGTRDGRDHNGVGSHSPRM